MHLAPFADPPAECTSLLLGTGMLQMDSSDMLGAVHIQHEDCAVFGTLQIAPRGTHVASSLVVLHQMRSGSILRLHVDMLPLSKTLYPSFDHVGTGCGRCTGPRWGLSGGCGLHLSSLTVREETKRWGAIGDSAVAAPQIQLAGAQCTFDARSALIFSS